MYEEAECLHQSLNLLWIWERLCAAPREKHIVDTYPQYVEHDIGDHLHDGLVWRVALPDINVEALVLRHESVRPIGCFWVADDSLTAILRPDPREEASWVEVEDLANSMHAGNEAQVFATGTVEIARALLHLGEQAVVLGAAANPRERMEEDHQLDSLKLHLCVHFRMMFPLNGNPPVHVPLEIALPPAL